MTVHFITQLDNDKAASRSSNHQRHQMNVAPMSVCFRWGNITTKFFGFNVRLGLLLSLTKRTELGSMSCVCTQSRTKGGCGTFAVVYRHCSDWD